MSSVSIWSHWTVDDAPLSETHQTAGTAKLPWSYREHTVYIQKLVPGPRKTCGKLYTREPRATVLKPHKCEMGIRLFVKTGTVNDLSLLAQYNTYMKHMQATCHADCNIPQATWANKHLLSLINLLTANSQNHFPTNNHIIATVVLRKNMTNAKRLYLALR